MRVCEWADCGTRLTTYNPRPTCYAHTPRAPTNSPGRIDARARKSDRPEGIERGLAALRQQLWGFDALAHHRPWWQDRAACIGKGRAEGDWWFSEESSAKRGQMTLAVRRAKAVCFRCPVQYECLVYALENERRGASRIGIWGGATEPERRSGRHLPECKGGCDGCVSIEDQAEAILGRIVSTGRELGLAKDEEGAA